MAQVIKIGFPYPLKKDSDIQKNSTTVHVTLDDGFTYSVRVGTFKNIKYLMDTNEVNYLPLGDEFQGIIVRKLTQDIIEETIKAYTEYENAYWIKFYHFTGAIDSTLLNNLMNLTVFNVLQSEFEITLRSSTDLDSTTLFKDSV